MLCKYQYYRCNTKELQPAVEHSDGKYQCEKMSACPYTDTTIINKIPWAGKGGHTLVEVQAEVMKESDETAAPTCRARQQQEDSESKTARKPGLLDKLKRLVRK